MLTKSKLALALSLALSMSMAAAPASYGANPAADSAPGTASAGESGKNMTREQFEASLKFQQGKITLPNNIATLNLPPTFRYLPPDDAERVLVDAWGNPPGAKTLGMLFPSNVSPVSPTGWGVIITYNEDGHVKDNDADSIKYDELLKDMQESTLAGNEERKKLGYDAMTLVGWAESPSYDKASHKFYWAKELAVEKDSTHSLNYNIRVLGRKGVLVLNAVAGMDQIGEVKKEMKDVVGFTEFTKGNSYSDFDGSTDKVAEYGLAALVAGGVAAKLGFFGKLLALLLVAKKLVLVGVVAIGGAIAKLFGRKKKDTD
uniref:DUF2167 domain-containing protein n=1 Tax=Undibacterium sp. TaxID=1914977 RepID=UPI00374DFAF8